MTSNGYPGSIGYNNYSPNTVYAPMNNGPVWTPPRSLYPPVQSESELSEEELARTQEQKHLFLKRTLIRNYLTDSLEPYDRSSYIPPKVEEDNCNNYFYLDICYQRPNGNPNYVLTNFSKTLSSFIRSEFSAVAQDWGSPWGSVNAPGVPPSIEIRKCFPRLPLFKKYLDRTQEALAKDPGADLNTRFLATQLGCVNAHDEDLLGPDVVRSYLSDIAQQMPILIDCLEEEFKPTAERLALLRETGHIEFDLLIYIFEEGEEYYSEGPYGECAFELVYRDSNHQAQGPYPGPGAPTDNWVSLQGRSVDWDGSGYTDRTVFHKIPRFEDKMKVSSLPCVKMTPEVKAELKARGEKYVSLAGIHYRSYLGERIIIDRSAYDEREIYPNNQLAPSKARPYHPPPPQIPRGGQWGDPQDGWAAAGMPKFLPLDDEGIAILPADEWHLLPSEVYGLELTSKDWRAFPVLDIRPVEFDSFAWDSLVLDMNTKTLLKSLVEVAAKPVKDKAASDFIKNKGGGLVSVLYGSPGTGKTLTAEAIAEHLRRPLYMIGSSELSTRASDMETRLRKVLELATAWGAIVLIDEADVYMEQRSLHELERNALVSVLLRILEYHRGVLFLTTNRISRFDEAFMSRISLAVRYPELDRPARFAIWSNFLAMVGCTVQERIPSGINVETDASDEESVMIVTSQAIRTRQDVAREVVHQAGTEEGFTKQPGSYITTKDVALLAEKPFNGRNIKNVVQAAQALAEAQDLPLNIEHIQIVVHSQEKFITEFQEAAQNEANRGRN